MAVAAGVGIDIYSVLVPTPTPTPAATATAPYEIVFPVDILASTPNGDLEFDEFDDEEEDVKKKLASRKKIDASCAQLLPNIQVCSRPISIE